jgi:hypothetical protein
MYRKKVSKMRRSEMIEYIADELRDIISVYLSSSPKYSGTDKFYKNKAENMLDMLEGFGMLPPPYFDSFYYDEPECDGMISEWEGE